MTTKKTSTTINDAGRSSPHPSEAHHRAGRDESDQQAEPMNFMQEEAQ